MSHTKPSVVIDADSHIGMPLDVWDYLPEDVKKRDDRPRFVEEDGSKIYKAGRYRFPPEGIQAAITPSAFAPGPEGGWNPDVMVEDFQLKEGVDRSCLMPHRFVSPAYLGDNELGNAVAHSYNTWLHNFCQKHPARLFGYGFLNVADINGAIAEMKRCVLELGFPCVVFNPSVIGNSPEDYKVLSDEHFYPLWDAAQSLNVPIGFHAFSDPYIPGHEHNWPRGPGLWSDIVGFPMQGMQMFMHLVAGGVCETFPDLRMGIFEAGVGWVPMVIERIHERVEKFGDMPKIMAPKMKLAPEEYIQRQIWFGFEPEDHFIHDFVKWSKAPNRLVFSADYPHLDYEPGQMGEYLGREDIEQDFVQKTLCDNALDFFRWEDTAVASQKTAAE